MKHTLRVAAILSMVLGGTAVADHWHGGGGGHGPVVRDHRGGGETVVVRDHRGPAGPAGRGPVVRDHRGPVVTHVRVNGGRYVFPGGVVRTYHRPVFHERYYNVHRRPEMIVESYDPVPGYMWVGGNWNWGGSEWIWQPGYWSVAAEPAPEPVVSGGVSISAGVHL